MNATSTHPAAPSRPRVLQCITRLGLGGAEAVAFSLVRGLRREFEFAVFAVRGVEDSEIGRAMRQELADLGVPLFSGPKLPIKLGGMVLAGLRAAQVARQFQPDLTHLHTEIPESAHASMVALRPRCANGALVRTIHNSVYWHFWPRLGRWCERRMTRSHVAAVSDDARAAFELHRKNSGAGPLPTPPVTIYNGVEVPLRSPPQPRTPNERLRILFAGRFELQKGTDLLPQILAQVNPPAPGCELVLHGSGTHEHLLKSLAQRPPTGWTICVLPAIADLRERMAEFDLVIMPSRFEGLGLVAVEAALIGLPVVTTDAPGLFEALPPDYPWRARPGDAAGFARGLQRALDERASWPAVTQRAGEFARKRFDVATMLAAYAQLYRSARGELTVAGSPDSVPPS